MQQPAPQTIIKRPQGRYIGEGQVDWYCVDIEHIRLAVAINVTFRNMLIEEYRGLGQPDHCRVYREAHAGGSFSYFFSPSAAEVLKAFLNFWNAYPVAEPTNLHQMEVVI